MIDRTEVGQQQHVLRKRKAMRASAEIHRFQEAVRGNTKDMTYKEKQCLLDGMSHYDYVSNRRSFSTFRDVFRNLGVRLPTTRDAPQENERMAALLSNNGIANTKIEWGDKSACIILRADIKLIREFLATRKSKES